jgi:hypothetical protein
MFKKPTKKQLLFRRTLFSVIATVSVLIIVTVSILFMLGYRLDSSNRLEQGALLQFNSAPSGAQVWIDGAFIGSTTATKQTVLAGNHSIKMTRSGYEDWNRTLDLQAGTLTWLDYVRLVPTNRSVQPVWDFDSLEALEFSPDLRWGLGLQVASEPEFDLIDLRSQQVKVTTLALGDELYSDATTPDVSHTFSIDTWSTGGRYAIVKHVYGENRTEWLLLDTQDLSRSVNITRSLSVDLREVKFASDSGMGLYGLTNDGVLRKLDVSGGTISRGLVTNVDQFTVFEEASVVGYTGTDPSDATMKVAGIYRDGDSGSRILRSSDDREVAFTIVVGRYFNEDYIAIAENNEVELLTGTLPSVATQESNLRRVTTMDLPGTITSLTFSPGGDYLVAQAGAQFSSYELEHNRRSNGIVAVNEGQSPATLEWLDSAHLWNTNNDAVFMRDFDGTNTFNIMPSLAGYDVTLSQNGRYFYSIGKNDKDGLQLQRVLMILE